MLKTARLRRTVAKLDALAVAAAAKQQGRRARCVEHIVRLEQDLPRLRQLVRIAPSRRHAVGLALMIEAAEERVRAWVHLGKGECLEAMYARRISWRLVNQAARAWRT